MTRRSRSKGKRLWQEVAKDWLVFGAAFVIFSFVAMVAVSPYLDTLGIEQWCCEVTSAKIKTSKGGNKGSVTTAGVVIYTKECGHIGYTKGVTSDNKFELAKSFKPGREYIFEVGWFSRAIMPNTPNGIPTAQSYRLVN
ncbi:hypothetical protein [Devriesea agamarum]|uniref:hypothetical protein n=1 Tax=Devriesea agamarum TaxID=472569 RepID=UPI00071C1FA0|nr:hypothetical protein [Devriesea agamarum]